MVLNKEYPPCCKEVLKNSKDLKLYTVEFAPMWPVGSALIILAENLPEARIMAKEIVTHTPVEKVNEILMDESKIIIYLSGDY